MDNPPIVKKNTEFYNPVYRFHQTDKLRSFSLWPRVYADWGDWLNTSADHATFSKPLSFVSHPGETGQDRLKEMFSKDEYGNMSPEVLKLYQVAVCAFLVGAIMGGSSGGRHAKEDWAKRNAATVFLNQIDANRRLQDTITVGMMRGAFRIGWRLSLFSSIFMLTSTSVSVYLNKSTIWEYLLGGAAAGGLYRWNMGIKAMISTGFFGGCLGFLAGGMYLGLSKLTGTTQEEIRYWRSTSRFSHQSEVYGRILDDQNQKLRKQVYEGEGKLEKQEPVKPNKVEIKAVDEKK